MPDPAELGYDAQGLIPAILQDAASGEVLMLGYMNEDTLRRTLEIGQAVFWSRSRQEVWHKGATSGDYARVLSVTTDCDADALVLQVEPLGGAVCHTGARSCFIDLDDGGEPRPVTLGATAAS
ncbi:MAG: phosphoribosyl-AMP cyclohydrolase [Chloroflexi bacterium]|nr:phosphoribosyl-AMP cyclohydrolase [Chloroflexota bacterium]